MNDYNELKAALRDFQQSQDTSTNNADFITSLIKANNDLKESIKALEDKNQKYYEHAVHKITELKRVCKDALGWDIKIKQGYVEMKSIFAKAENEIIVLKDNEHSFEILDSDHSKNLFMNNPNLHDIMKVSIPLLFGYINILLKPDIKDLYFVY